MNAHIGVSIDFLDLSIENREGKLITNVYHKPSYEPYYLPFNSIHPIHMKKNIPFIMLLRAIRYCSTFDLFIKERESLRMSLLLNKYPNDFIQNQFNRVFQKFKVIEEINSLNYQIIRTSVISHPDKEKSNTDYENNLFIHFTYCSKMRTFPIQFHTLWNKYFSNSPISDISPILGIRNVDNLQRKLIHNS